MRFHWGLAPGHTYTHNDMSTSSFTHTPEADDDGEDAEQEIQAGQEEQVDAQPDEENDGRALGHDGSDEDVDAGSSDEDAVVS